MNESAREWLGTSDLMAGLMMVFLFLAVLFMLKIKQDSEHSDDIVEQEPLEMTYSQYRDELHQALRDAFPQESLDAWNATILNDNTIQFHAIEILFETGESIIKDQFKADLSEFFPRYVDVLENFENRITEIRIEGHSSSEWKKAKSSDERYLKNAKLAQDRAYAVLKFCYELEELEASKKEWLTEVLSAKGWAFAQPAYFRGWASPLRSRRVNFRALTKDDERTESLLRDDEEYEP